ncbi:hypothetical protein C0993_001179 [Termitomyces sp. T159_Od127]|nr:hypothetical protein C0993_001179 [Termitomyces sp. T159_Od127]
MRLLAAVPVLLALAAAQDPSSTSSSPSSSSSASPSPSLSLSLTTANVTSTLSTRTQNQNTLITTVLPTTFNVTRTISSTSSSVSSSASSASSSASASPTPSPIVLDTKLDPAFGVLGALLIITGLPSAFWGHKNRWTSFFLTGFYTLSLVCFVLILKFGILAAINPPSKTLRGMFVLSSAIAGFAGGAIAIFFWKATRYAIGAWGGFAVALWIQCFHNGGLIKSVGLRWILYIGTPLSINHPAPRANHMSLGCAVIGFILCTIPKIHYHILLISTAFVGSSAFILGVDCFTTAGLKEFYIWNLGFRSLFPKFTNNGIEYPVSQIMQIELGLIGAIALMGVAVQLRILSVLHRKLGEISEEQKKRDQDAEAVAADKFKDVKREQAEWETEHPTLPRYGRQESGYSSLPTKDQDGSSSPTTVEHEHHSSTFTLVAEGRARRHSNISDFKAAPTPDEELRRAARNMQSPGALPALDLGLGIQEDVPSGFIASDEPHSQSQPEGLQKKNSLNGLEELKRKESLIQEIQTIRRSIEALKSETPVSSSPSTSRHPSIASRRTLSIDAGSALLPIPSHLRPPRETNPRARAHSIELSSLGYLPPPGDTVSRPTSVPRDEEWDAYLHERKLLQPPSGITPPISTTPAATAPRLPISPAVSEALNKRKQRESALAFGDQHSSDSSEDVPLAQLAKHKRDSSGGNIPVTILPPKKPTAVLLPTSQRPGHTRTRTFEELNERHREKMRDLQAPLTQAEKEEADIMAARQRWERNKAAEKEAFKRRQADKNAQYEKERRKRPEDDGDRKGQKPVTRMEGRRHSRSVSHDRLGRTGSSSKRLSTLKVEDWQRYQEAEANHRAEATTSSGSGSKRDSRPLLSQSTGVPFPEGRKRSQRMSHDPLS